MKFMVQMSCNTLERVQQLGILRVMVSYKCLSEHLVFLLTAIASKVLYT
jgi:hypothetical protein